MDHNQILEFLQDVGARAGEILISSFRGDFKIEKKGAPESRDIVTEVDKASEKLIVSEINKAFPDHDILAEESELERKGSRWLWMIDPLDGTVNFSRGYPFFCVSMALVEDGDLLAGFVRNPFHDETFYAIRGKGGFLNGNPIRVSSVDSLRNSVVATGFPYDRAISQENNIGEFSRVAPAVQGMRRGGSAAIDLCYVACGRLDGFWELKLKPWDMAAGMLIVEESGGRVTDDKGLETDPYTHCVVATNGLIHDELLSTLGRRDYSSCRE